MDYLDKYDELIRILTEEIEIDGKKYDLKEDFEKFFIRSNKTAGTRIRRVMQEIKKYIIYKINQIENLNINL
jgi:hypothetical protein